MIKEQKIEPSKMKENLEEISSIDENSDEPEEKAIPNARGSNIGEDEKEPAENQMAAEMNQVLAELREQGLEDEAPEKKALGSSQMDMRGVVGLNSEVLAKMELKPIKEDDLW